MEAIGLIAVSFVGAVFWVVSAEGAAVLYGARGWNPFLVGLLCASGQLAMHLLLYLGGEGLVLKWQWLGRKVDKTRSRFGGHLEERYLVMTALASLFGIPPVVAMSLLAYGFKVKLSHLVPVIFFGRAVRFTILSAWGDALGPSVRALLPW